MSSFSTSPAGFSKFNSGNVILFQIKVYARNVKEITPPKYFIKVTERPSFTRLGVTKRINTVH